MTPLRRILERAVLIALSPVILALIIVALPIGLLAMGLHWIDGVLLRWRFRRKWNARGKDLLLVYSNSPHWQARIENDWLPRVRDRAVILNWSQRAEWRRTARLESRVFAHFAGDSEFNPIVIHLPRRGPVTTIRFWDAFRKAKHGDGVLLAMYEEQLFALPSRGTQAAA